MSKSRKGKARMEAGLNVAGREAKATEKNKVFECNANHISKVVKELSDNGVGLSCNSKESQKSMLLRALKFRGARGLNTYEGTAAGYVRLATRVQEVEEDGWIVLSNPENLIGPDGLFHPRIARYVLVGKRSDGSQLQLPLERSQYIETMPGAAKTEAV